VLIKIVYWIIVCGDIAGLLLLFVLGLAAAPSAKASTLGVAAYLLVVPGLLLGASILLFLRATSPVWRGAAFLLAASPLLVFVLLRGVEEAKLRMNTDSQGNLTYFRAGPMRDIATAISANDAATVISLAPKVDLNTSGYGGRTLLMSALRQLATTPDRLEVFRALMKAGADPNAGAGELPLETAIQISPKTGPEPVMMLLAAGAKPNAKNSFGSPVYFAATGKPVDIEILKALLDHGADLKAQAPQGRNVVIEAATSPNWKAVLLLMRRGADWKQVRDVNGLPFKEMVESHRRVYGDEEGLAEVIEYLGRQ
jgi:hypothetical protein